MKLSLPIPLTKGSFYGLLFMIPIKRIFQMLRNNRLNKEEKYDVGSDLLCISLLPSTTKIRGVGVMDKQASQLCRTLTAVSLHKFE